jgi:uncharacterized protein YndB with AHSA1/START domain
VTVRNDEQNAVMDEATVTTPGDHQIVITRRFEAPRATVFEAWTKPEHVSQWWDPGGAPLASCEIDLRPGGEFRFVNQGNHGPAFTGTYREITPPERLVFTTHVGPLHGGTTGTVEFHESNGSTRLVITMECQSAADRDAMLRIGVAEGTVRTLANLAAYLAR